MPAQTVRPGEELAISADVYNFAVNQYMRSIGRGTSGGGFRDRPNYSSILVRNDSGQAVNRFGPVALGSPLISPQVNLDAFQSQVAMSFLVAPTTSQAFTYAVLQEPIAAGEMGLALVSGVTPVIIDIPTSGAAVQFAGPNGTFVSLQRTNCGICRVLWMSSSPTSSGSGKAWAIVNLG